MCAKSFDACHGAQLILIGHRSDAAFGHDEERGHSVESAQRRFDAANQIVGFEDEQHLTIDLFENLRDTGQNDRGGRLKNVFLEWKAFGISSSNSRKINMTHLARGMWRLVYSSNNRLPGPSGQHTRKQWIQITFNTQIQTVLAHADTINTQNAQPEFGIFIPKALG